MHYRFYEVDADGHVLTGYSVECPSDTAALRAAHRLVQRRAAAVEVWQAARGVGRVSAVDDDRDPELGNEASLRHDGCGGRAAKAELLTGIEGGSSQPVRRIVLRAG